MEIGAHAAIRSPETRPFQQECRRHPISRFSVHQPVFALLDDTQLETEQLAHGCGRQDSLLCSGPEPGQSTWRGPAMSFPCVPTLAVCPAAWIGKTKGQNAEWRKDNEWSTGCSSG